MKPREVLLHCACVQSALRNSAEEVRQCLNYALRHALIECTINSVLLAITHAYKCSWQLKPHYFAGGSEGLSR